MFLVKRFDIGTKHIARLYVEVCKTDKIGLNLWQPSTSCLCTFKNPYIIPRLVPTGFTELHLSFDILLESTKFSKMGSVRFS